MWSCAINNEIVFEIFTFLIYQSQIPETLWRVKVHSRGFPDHLVVRARTELDNNNSSSDSDSGNK